MRLDILENGHSPVQKGLLKLITAIMGGFVPGPVLLQSYRPELFGRPFNENVKMALRGTRYWKKSEAELLAAFVSKNNHCDFCMDAHSAIAVHGVEPRVVKAVLDDWRSAPVDMRLWTTFFFLEKLTRTPADTHRDDIEMMRQAGVTEEGIEEAIRICFVFCTINRLADAFDFELADRRQRGRMGALLHYLGYDLAVIPG